MARDLYLVCSLMCPVISKASPGIDQINQYLLNLQTLSYCWCSVLLLVQLFLFDFFLHCKHESIHIIHN